MDNYFFSLPRHPNISQKLLLLFPKVRSDQFNNAVPFLYHLDSVTFRKNVTDIHHGVLCVASRLKYVILHKAKGWNPITPSSPKALGHNGFPCSPTWKHRPYHNVEALTRHYIQTPLFRHFSSCWLISFSFILIHLSQWSMNPLYIFHGHLLSLSFSTQQQLHHLIIILFLASQDPHLACS